MNHSLTGKDIIVVGAGISGLAFSIAFHRQWLASSSAPRIRVFERDSYDERVGREGYALSLRSDDRSGGIQALDRIGLYEKALAASITGSDSEHEQGCFCIWDRNWKPLLKIRSKAIGPKALRSMRIRRNALQRVLADALAGTETQILWGKTFVGVELVENGPIKVSFNDGSEERCDLLVAADGASSKLLASLRPDRKLNFAGAVCIGGTSRFESEQLVPEPVNRDWGSVLAGHGIGLFASPVDKTSASWNISYMAPQPRQGIRHPLSAEQVASILDEVKTLGKTFPEPFLKLVNETDPSTLMVLNTMDRMPFPHGPLDQKHGKVIFLGDANHAVSPFAGNGANLALMDGWDLATCLISEATLKGALIKYDKLSMPRAVSTVKFSHFSIDMAHAQGIRLMLYTILARILGWFVPH